MSRIRRVLAAMLLACATAAPAATIEIEVNGLVCAFCAQGIEKTLRKFPATGDVFVSLEHRLVAVQVEEGGTIDDEELERAITDAGYSIVRVKRTDTPLDEIRARVKAGRARGG